MEQKFIRTLPSSLSNETLKNDISQINATQADLVAALKELTSINEQLSEAVAEAQKTADNALVLHGLMGIVMVAASAFLFFHK